MDQLRAIRYFISVAESGNFTKSAQRFNVPPSSLSRRIADLEQSLGATLLQRTTRVVKLTEVGRDYYANVKQLVTQLEQSNASVHSYHSEPTGTLRVSSLVGFGETTLMPLLDEFCALYPKIILDVHLTDSVSTLDRDEIDIAIRGGYAPNERVVAVKLMDNSFCPVASPAYLKKHGTPVNAVELTKHQGLYFRTPAGPTPWLAFINEQWQDVSAPAIATTNYGQWLIQKTINGEGIIFLPKWVTEPYERSGELISIELIEPVGITSQPNFALYLLYQKHRYAVPKVKAAVDFIVGKIKNG